MDKINFKNAAKKNKNLKYGGFMTIVIIIAIALFVLVNVLFQQLHINIDLTPEQLYSIGSKTQVILNDVQDDITIYGLYVNGNENNEAISLIQDYVSHCSRISYKQVDPYQNPEFTEPYRQDNESIPAMSLIVVNERTKKFKVLSNTDLYEYKQVMNENTYSYDYQITAFGAEEALTSAVQYVTNESTPKVLLLTGHSEMPFSSSIKSLFVKANYDFQSLNLITDEALLVPSTSTILFINNPALDLSEYEYEALLNYMQNGGQCVLNLCATYPIENMTYFNKFMERFGISPVQGTLIETDTNRYLRYPYLLVPTVEESEVTGSVEANTVVSALAMGLKIQDEHNRNTEITPILTTSENAIAKQNSNSDVMEFEEGDEKGPFYVGLLAEEPVPMDGTYMTARLAVYGSAYMFDADSGYVTTGNYNLLYGTMDHMNSDYESIYISPKTYVGQEVTVTTGAIVAQGAFFILVLPLAVIIIGLVVWGRRKRL